MQGQFRHIVIDANGDLWAGTYIDGLNQYSLSYTEEGKLSLMQKKHYGEETFGKDEVSALFVDNTGIVWLGLTGGGAYCHIPHSERFRTYRKTNDIGSLGYNNVRAIFEDSKSNLWIGTQGGGASFMPSDKKKNYESGFLNFKTQPNIGDSELIYAFDEAKKNGEGVVYAGTGFPRRCVELKYNGKNVNVKPLNVASDFNAVFDIYVDKENVSWMATYGKGLFVIYPDGKVFNFRNNPDDISTITSDVVRSVFEDADGNIWVGTDKGLNRIKAEIKYNEKVSFNRFVADPQNPHSLSHNYILPITQSRNGDIWIGTMGGGLNRLMPGTDTTPVRFVALTKSEGLPNNVIKAIIEDDEGYLWLSTNRGLTRLDPGTLEIRNFDVNDGLQDYDFGELAACKRSDGELLFGGVNGFNAFYPHEIQLDIVPPKMVITKLQLLNQEINVGQEFNGRVIIEKSIDNTKHLKLRYSENSIAFHFAALHFAAPKKNQYRYKLVGIDNNWIRTSSNDRTAKYTYLPPGDYKFMLEGTNLDGVWCDKPAIIDITITPPWWRSQAAFIIYAILLVVAVIGVYRLSLHRSKRRTELEMERFEKKKVKELSDMKLRFYTNISHEFRTPLTLIVGPLEKLMREGIGFSENKRQENYSIIHRNASILLRLINQLMDFRKFEQGKMSLIAAKGDVNEFVHEMYSSFEEYAERKNVDFNLKLPDNKVELWFDRDKLEKIIYNLLSNAFKFTQPGGAITLSLNEHIDFVTISVRDTGLGMSDEMQKHVFERFYQSKRIRNRQIGSTGVGLAFTKGLVELHHGKIDFESKMNEGTTFFIELPKGKGHLSEDEILSESNAKNEQYLPLEGVPELKMVDRGAECDEEPRTVTEGPKVLVVEDNDDLRKFLVEQLANKFTVGEAIDGEVGWETCQQMQPDIIISDVMMPRMDGYEMCNKIKNDEHTSHIPVVLLTAKTSPEYQLKGFKTGADAYVAKPFQYPVLEARLEAILKSREKMRGIYRKSTEIKPSEVTMTSMDEKFMERIVKIVEENMSKEDFTVEQLSGEYGMTQNLLNKKLRSLTGLTSKAFIRSIRMKRAAQLLELGRYTVADVTYEVGMNDLKYFRQCFKAEFGITPSDYMKSKKKDVPDEEQTE